MTTRRIPIGDGGRGDFSFPLDAATQTFAFIARRGAGKTYAAGKLVEGFAEAGIQFVVLDSVGNWWGLRVAADGRGRGIDIPLLGGLRGDIPLEAGAGALIADIAVDSGKSLVLDVSQFSKSDRQRFATALGERLWRRKKAEQSPGPIHIVIEESQLIVPEQVGKDQTTMVGVYEEIIRLGRNYGIGCTLITQRPQSVNKEVLNQTECLFVLQVNGAHEREALKKWIVHQGMDTKIVNELPALPQGTAYVWSPQWLGILEKVAIGKKWTFDASATPKAGQPRKGGEVKPIDLEELKGNMAHAVREAEANDPKRLRARIAELEREAKMAMPKARDAAAAQRAIDGAVKARDSFWQRELALVRQRQTSLKKLPQLLRDAAQTIETAAAAQVAAAPPAVTERGGGSMVHSGRPATAAANPPTGASEIRASTPSRAPPAAARSTAGVSLNGHASTAGVSGRQQRFLDAAASLTALGAEVSRVTVAGWCGVHPRGGSVGEELKALVDAGLIELDRGSIRVTNTGTAAANVMDQEQAIAAAKSGLSPRQTRIFEIVCCAYPNTVMRDAVAEQMGIHPRGGSFGEDIGALAGRGLISSWRGELKAKEFLFAGCA